MKFLRGVHLVEMHRSVEKDAHPLPASRRDAPHKTC
jgi:hypothetical protein